jgi:anti-sigma-K factor RskA
MSDTDDNLTPQQRSAIAAAEYVLGVLDAAERVDIGRRISDDPPLAIEVAAWEQRLGGIADQVAPVPPPAAVWPRIAAAVTDSASRQRSGLWESIAFWRAFATGSAALAAVSVGILAYVATTPPAHETYLATLGGSGGQPQFVAAVGGDGKSVTVVPASLLTSDRVWELWLIPSGDRPHSLGLIQPGQAVHLDVPQNLVGQVAADVTLAVTIEPPGGAPNGVPTGPVIASGKLTRL